MITVVGSGFGSDNERPSWTAALKRWVLERYNELYAVGGNPALSNSVNLAFEGLDRAHKVSFSDIQAKVLAFINGTVSDTDFQKLTDGLYGHQPAGQKALAEMKKQRFMLIQAKKLGSAIPIQQRANQLLRYLNSAIGNVLLGDAASNRSIQEHLDVHFQKKPSGEWQLTPDSRNIGGVWKGEHSGVPLTPKGQHMMTSSTFATIDIYDLSPKSSAVLGF